MKNELFLKLKAAVPHLTLTLALCVAATVSTGFATYSLFVGGSLSIVTALIWACAITGMVLPLLLDFEMSYPVLLIRYLGFALVLGILYLAGPYVGPVAASFILLVWRWADVSLTWWNWHLTK